MFKPPRTGLWINVAYVNKAQCPGWLIYKTRLIKNVLYVVRSKLEQFIFQSQTIRVFIYQFANTVVCVSSVFMNVSAGCKWGTADLITSVVRFLCQSTCHWNLNATVRFIVKRDYGPIIAAQSHRDTHQRGRFWSKPCWRTNDTLKHKMTR